MLRIPGKYPLLSFALGVFCLAVIIFAVVHAGRVHVPGPTGLRRAAGELFGVTGLWLLIFIYLRSALKMVVPYEGWLRRVLPPQHVPAAQTGARRLVQVLTRWHKYMGGLAAVVLCMHALLMGPSRWNMLLVVVLCALLWQGVSGLLLAARSPNPQARRFRYAAHAQLYTGVVIVICAGLGHQLV